MGWKEVWKAIGPFNQADVSGRTVFVPADGIEFFGAVDAVEIEVADGGDGRGIFLNNGEGRAALKLIGVVSEGGNDAAGEAGFAGAKRAGESEDVARAEGLSEACGGELSGARRVCFNM